jgi:hypothetical protein
MYREEKKTWASLIEGADLRIHSTGLNRGAVSVSSSVSCMPAISMKNRKTENPKNSKTWRTAEKGTRKSMSQVGYVDRYGHGRVTVLDDSTAACLAEYPPGMDSSVRGTMETSRQRSTVEVQREDQTVSSPSGGGRPRRWMSSSPGREKQKSSGGKKGHIFFWG